MLLTIAIATFNSEKFLPRVIQAIRRQSLPVSEYEILIVDGGSTDNTHQLAAANNCKILQNPRTEPVYAKYLAYINACSRYLMYLDHDEILIDVDSLKKRLAFLNQNPSCIAVVSAGYRNPKSYSKINEYINEYGDPFSLFFYRLSKDYRFFLSSLKNKYEFKKVSLGEYCFQFSSHIDLPIIELCACGALIDLHFFREKFPKLSEDFRLIPHLFYLAVSKQSVSIGAIEGDIIDHYSSENVSRYLRKIKWRVKNNIFFSKGMGQSGFLGREAYSPVLKRVKKFLFIPYALLVLPALVDSFYLVFSRKNSVYILHFCLAFYTAFLICFFMVLKLLGFSPPLKSYDDSKVISHFG